MKDTMKPNEQDMNAPDVENVDLERDDEVIGKAFRWSLAVFALVGVVVAGVVLWVNSTRKPIEERVTPLALPQVRDAAPADVPVVHFTDVTAKAGIDFTHVNGAYGEKLLPETMGAGCAFFDYDGDGDQDLLLVNATHWPWHSDSAQGPAPTMKLFRNDGAGHFTDATAGSGLEVSFYGMGAVVGDYDNDGRVDLFVTAVGPNHLFHNLGDGKFAEVTAAAGVAGESQRWSTSAGFFDADNDGDLDLFVCNYVQWSRELDIAQGFVLTGIGRAYGPPTAFEGAFPYLYRNNGDGTFTDVSESAGVQVRNAATGVPVAKSLAVAPADLDGDGFVDLVVANDTVQNFVFHNQHDGTFKEVGAVSGVAFDSAGNARGAMGIDAARFRNDRAMGLAIGNFANEMTALYVARDGAMQFTDDAIATGLGPPMRQVLTFGLFFFDVDLDGRLDVLAANGHLEEDINKVQSSQHYRQPAQLFWNCGPQQPAEFVRVPDEKLGPQFTRPIVGRAAAFADIDGDGDLDVIITQVAGPPLVLRNDQKLGRHWLRFKLTGDPASHVNHDAVGAWIEVNVAGKTIARQVMPTRSYLSQVELPVTIGIGDKTAVDQVTVTWPGGAKQTVSNVKIDGVTAVKFAPGTSAGE